MYALKVRRCECTLPPTTTDDGIFLLQGLQAPGGYYRVTQPVGDVAYTFWFQARP